MSRRALAVQLFAVLMMLLAVPVSAETEPAVSIDAEAGFQNKVKYGEGVPVTFTLTNEGPDFSGDLVVDYSENFNLAGGVAVPLELLEGETKTIQVALSGLTDDMMYSGSQVQTVFLYEGGWEDGDSIPFEGPKSLRPAYYDTSALFIGTLTSSADRLLPLRNLSPSGSSSVELFHFNQMDQFAFPDEALAYDALDVLLVDDVAYSSLPQPAQEALLQWVREGGRIVLGASGSAETEAGTLSGYLPLQLGDRKEVTVSGFESRVPGYGATLSEGAEAVAESGGQPVAGQLAVGAGAVIQLAFPLGDETVTADSGYPAFMDSLLRTKADPASAMTGQSIKDRIAYDIASTNELFESFAVSAPGVMAAVFLYILLTVPVLYIILKKKDKREYAWILIPAIGILMSVLLFAVGARDRIGQPQIQQTGFFEANETGGLNGYYVHSILTNKGGDYQFESPSGTGMSRYLSGPFSGEQMHQQAVLERGTEKNSLTLRNLRYWSVSSIIGESYIGQAGNFAADLLVSGKRLSGTIRNDYPFTFEEVAVWTGTRLIPVGSLSPGEELTVEETLRSDMLAPAAAIGQAYSQQPVTDAEGLLDARKQAVLSVSYDQLADNEPSPYVIGYTNEAIVPVTLTENRPSLSAVNLVAQPVSPALELSGEVTFDSSFFGLDVSALNPGGYFERVTDDPFLYYMEDGDYELTYTMPDTLDQPVEFRELTVSASRPSGETAVFNSETGEYEPLGSGKQVLTKNLDRYVSDQGEIRLKLKMSGTASSPEVTLPKLTMEGAVTP